MASLRFRLQGGDVGVSVVLEVLPGPATSGAPDDTREAREKIAREIHIAMREHVVLADTPWPLYLDQWERSVRASWEAEHLDGPWPGLASKAVNQVMARKIAIEDNGGPLSEGYMLAVLRQKTRRPDLTLGPDLANGLAERCTIKQLRDLLSTMVNRIAAREGRGATANRNKSSETTRSKCAEGL